MTVEEYKTELERINKEVIDLRQKLKETEKAYIADHSPFVVGQKVLVTNSSDKEEPAFIKSIYVSGKKEIGYKFLKCKKDGTPSRHELWVWLFKEIKPF